MSHSPCVLERERASDRAHRSGNGVGILFLGLVTSDWYESGSTLGGFPKTDHGSLPPVFQKMVSVASPLEQWLACLPAEVPGSMASRAFGKP
jgi:hypothetical protein